MAIDFRIFFKKKCKKHTFCAPLVHFSGYFACFQLQKNQNRRESLPVVRGCFPPIGGGGN